MEGLSQGEHGTARPYRSHHIPACQRCRQRKARCTQDSPGQPCLLCKLHGITCRRAVSTAAVKDVHNTSVGINKHSKRSTVPSAKRRAKSRAAELQEEDEDISNSDKSSNSLPHIIGPIVAQDAQLLDRHLESSDKGQNGLEQSIRPFNTYSDDPKKPVLYLKVSREREGFPRRNQGGFRHSQILEKLLEPYVAEIVGLYFKKFDPCFPVLKSRHSMSDGGDLAGISEALRSEIYSISLTYWNHSPKLKSHPRPDVRYVWNLAVGSLHDDFLKPDMSTIAAALIDLTGRPIFSITGNALTLGRVVALAHALGLNRDPTEWRLTEAEKSWRIRLWWALLIHDTWLSLSYGTPPLIQQANFDIPIPTIEMLLSSSIRTKEHSRAAQCFRELCKLTDIVGDLIPLAFDLRTTKFQDVRKRLDELEVRLEAWMEALPSWLSFDENTPSISVPGAKSLNLSYHAASLMLHRLGLYSSSQTNEAHDNRLHLHLLKECRQVAGRIVKLVTNLSAEDLDVFWLPYTGHHFALATTTLLRYVLNDDNSSIAKESLEDAKSMIATLRTFSDEHSWDLAETCLNRCEAIVQRISHAGSRSEREHDTNTELAPNDFQDLMADSNIDGFMHADWAGDAFWFYDMNLWPPSEYANDMVFPNVST